MHDLSRKRPLVDIKPIKNDADYEAALKEIERLFIAELNTPEGDRLEVLMILVEAYEDEHYDIPSPDPIDAIEYHMESRGLTRRDLQQYIGSRARVSEILNRRRPLTLRMIRKLEAGLGIPAEILIQPYALAGSLGTGVDVRRDAHWTWDDVQDISELHHAVFKTFVASECRLEDLLCLRRYTFGALSTSQPSRQEAGTWVERLTDATETAWNVDTSPPYDMPATQPCWFYVVDESEPKQSVPTMVRQEETVQ